MLMREPLKKEAPMTGLWRQQCTSGRIAEDKGSEKNFMRRLKKPCGEWEF